MSLRRQVMSEAGSGPILTHACVSSLDCHTRERRNVLSMIMIFLCTHPPFATQVPRALVPPVLVRVGRRGLLAFPATQETEKEGT
jgi:hypothetical protein